MEGITSVIEEIHFKVLRRFLRMMDEEYRTHFTASNSLLIDCYKLNKDLMSYCHKAEVSAQQFLSVRGINSTQLYKAVRAYHSFDKGLSNSQYDKLYKEGDIPRACTPLNNVGRIKIYQFMEICKAIKKDPQNYILKETAPKEDMEIKEEPKTEKEVLEEVLSPILTELRIANTYLERLMMAWGA